MDFQLLFSDDKSKWCLDVLTEKSYVNSYYPNVSARDVYVQRVKLQFFKSTLLVRYDAFSKSRRAVIVVSIWSENLIRPFPRTIRCIFIGLTLTQPQHRALDNRSN